MNSEAKHTYLTATKRVPDMFRIEEWLEEMITSTRFVILERSRLWVRLKAVLTAKDIDAIRGDLESAHNPYNIVLEVDAPSKS